MFLVEEGERGRLFTNAEKHSPIWRTIQGLEKCSQIKSTDRSSRGPLPSHGPTAVRMQFLLLNTEYKGFCFGLLMSEFHLKLQIGETN